MAEDTRELAVAESFDDVVLPHLDAAYNLARWLVRNPHDAEDIVQEAYLRALKFFGGYRGGDSRAWVLKIVRNASYSFLHKNRAADLAVEFDETVHATEAVPRDTETTLLQSMDIGALRDALKQLPVNFRELLVLRELEGLSYKEIAGVTGTPIGTVMSGLSRGRAELRELLLRIRSKEERRGMPR
jgi:RNA polymerase sigma-70 factor, ECF subfamily